MPCFSSPSLLLATAVAALTKELAGTGLHPGFAGHSNPRAHTYSGLSSRSWTRSTVWAGQLWLAKLTSGCHDDTARPRTAAAFLYWYAHGVRCAQQSTGCSRPAPVRSFVSATTAAAGSKDGEELVLV